MNPQNPAYTPTYLLPEVSSSMRDTVQQGIATLGNEAYAKQAGLKLIHGDPVIVDELNHWAVQYPEQARDDIFMTAALTYAALADSGPIPKVSYAITQQVRAAIELSGDEAFFLAAAERIKARNPGLMNVVAGTAELLLRREMSPALKVLSAASMTLVHELLHEAAMSNPNFADQVGGQAT